MATWRCPHCATVQIEASECFLCHRSATSCGTCVNFRASLVGDVGYCALDRRREPLSGAEERPCWTGSLEPVIDDLFEAAASRQPPAPEPERSTGSVLEVRRSGGLRPVETQPPISGT